ncbi:MAG TPA: hypothetical protein VH186_30610 [Chloroflexia bacterium]|nr:hypothetical protein [Chloroflexia bacterium]
MPKALKIVVSIFVGLDVSFVSFMTLANLRYNLFGTNEVPGLGSAFDMGLFLLALLIGYAAGDRLFYFMNYNQRREARLKAMQEAERQQEAREEEKRRRREMVLASNRQNLATTGTTESEIKGDQK